MIMAHILHWKASHDPNTWHDTRHIVAVSGVVVVIIVTIRMIHNIIPVSLVVSFILGRCPHYDGYHLTGTGQRVPLSVEIPLT